MKASHILAICALVLGNSLPVAGWAQNTSPMSAPQAPAALTDGEVKKIDPGTGKITIKHGDIKHLDMPGMTMVFTAKDRTLLAPRKVGDRIRFMATDEGGTLFVTEIQPVPR